MTVALHDLVLQLEDLSGETGLDPDAPITELPIDSLVLIEWLYSVEEATGVPILEVFQDSEDLDDLSMRSFHVRLVGWVETVAR